MSAARYQVLWQGALEPDALALEDDPGARIELSARERAEQEAAVARRAAAGQRIDRTPAGGYPPLYRLASFEAPAGGGLRLSLGRTDYAEYLYTNVEHPERRAARGDAAMSDALAVCAVLVTADGRVPFGLRAPAIADRGPGRRVHLLPSGHPVPPATPFEGLLLELEEEAGIRPDELVRARLTGLVRALPTGKPELTYLLETRVPLDALLARERRDAWEFTALDSFAWTPEGARRWLDEHSEDAAPPGHAAVALALQAD